jgi:hypothetical protein
MRVEEKFHSLLFYLLLMEVAKPMTVIFVRHGESMNNAIRHGMDEEAYQLARGPDISLSDHGV